MESLFKRHKPQRGRVFLMLAGSLLVHGGIVGIGALLERPEQEKVDVGWMPPDYGNPEPLKPDSLPAEPTNTPDVVPTATPEVLESADATPPSTEVDPELAEPATPTPARKLAAKPVTRVKTAVPRVTNTVSTTPGQGNPGTGNGALPGSATTWVMPHPPYPATARGFANGAGLTVIRITTDATGSVSNVVVVRSAGNPLLDAHTVSYVREHWRGPANASRTTEFLYQLR